jgi:hypothetical protein
MIIDHIGFAFFPNAIILRLIGRISFPIFAFQLSVGYSHSKNKLKHIFTMLSFAIISQIPYMLFVSTAEESFALNIGFTLLLGLLCLYSIENINDKLLSTAVIGILLLVAAYLPIDYGVYGILSILFFYLFRDNKFATLVSQIIANIYYGLTLGIWAQSLSLISLIPIFLYNNKKGRSCKWLFYIFYPAHLLIIYFIYNLLK